MAKDEKSGGEMDWRSQRTLINALYNLDQRTPAQKAEFARASKIVATPTAELAGIGDVLNRRNYYEAALKYGKDEARKQEAQAEIDACKARLTQLGYQEPNNTES